MSSTLVQIESAASAGRRYWRGLDDLAGSPEFKSWVAQEFPDGAVDPPGPASRRTLLKLMAASFGLAGLTACRRPVEAILPHAKGVENYILGVPQHYATVAAIGGAAAGLLVEAHDGRPTKVEGNPRHPHSLGATTSHQQALLLNLYDPDRAKAPRFKGARASWEDFAAFAREHFTPAKLGQGEGLRIVAERSSSPSLAAVRAALLRQFPQARWIEYESVSFDASRAGLEMAFGQPLEVHPRYDQADVVVALDCDFLGLDSLTVLPTKQFSARRRSGRPADELNRLYAVEANFTLTGAMADHRLRTRSSDIGALALSLARELGLPVAAAPASKFIAAAARDLAAHKGRSLVVAGPRQPAAVHALVALINQSLGNAGATIHYTAPAVAGDSLAAVRGLAADLKSGAVTTLIALGGNPAYTLPADVEFAAALQKAPVSIALAPDENETWAAATWQLPETHPFEAWSDARALDGTLAVQQPLIEPLYAAKSVLEVAAILAGQPVTKPFDIVKSTVTAAWGPAERDARWRKALHDGWIEGTAAAPVKATADAKKVLAAAEAALRPAASGLEIAFYPSSHAWDGRFANNGWMQEAPDPMTKLVWDNAALLSPKTAAALQVADGDLLEISANGRRATLPAMLLPGHADDSISLALGHGRAHCGRVGRGTGHRVETLRTLDGFHSAAAAVRKTGARYPLVTTQEHHRMEDPILHIHRPIVREATTEEYRKDPHVIAEQAEQPPALSMFPAWDYSQGYQWALAIDLNACTGCNACVVACQAENNVPVVGKEQVEKGREMHWIRMDRYFTGSEDDPQVVTQPMACQQCENAPCESVCPVAATTHSPEGLNEMAYNRCVGTRYCSNNCPYKVRRFNFLNFHKRIEETEKMVFNPDVTVRMRGVMEKCNYCVQRIQEVRIHAKADDRRPIRDGEIQTACQQVCPAEAITFGNINDPQSRVAKLKRQERNYAVLEELNIKPRTSYLARLRNPNPELA